MTVDLGKREETKDVPGEGSCVRRGNLVLGSWVSRL